MTTCAETPDAPRIWVDRVASHIHDPVRRLRFLKAVSPAPPPPAEDEQPRRPVMRICLATVAGLVVLFAVISLSRLVASVRTHDSSATAPAPSLAVAAVEPATAVRPAADVWLVEKSGDSETYSNGLRIDSRFEVATHRRSYLAFPAAGGDPARRSDPAGIVFHTTESQQVPFEESENRALKRIGESLLDFIRRRQAYNFVIDRFGRVYRVVSEDQVANHSGNSVWADENWSYVNLNRSFLAISFEAVSPAANKDAEMSAAQVHAGALLVEMLRRRFQIPAANCVTHAQVSVNPANMRLGFHVDWASGFPFESMGLPDNYATALPALWAYGFDYDASFTNLATPRMRTSILEAEEILKRRAAAGGLTPAAYRSKLRQHYRELFAKVR
jgi:N-acetylmuramoyl-L-alanine amidase